MAPTLVWEDEAADTAVGIRPELEDDGTSDEVDMYVDVEENELIAEVAEELVDDTGVVDVIEDDDRDVEVVTEDEYEEDDVVDGEDAELGGTDAVPVVPEVDVLDSGIDEMGRRLNGNVGIVRVVELEGV